MSFAAALQVLRDAAWLTPQRAKAYSKLFLLIAALAAVGWIVASRGGLDPLGKPLGADFPSFWTASRLALGGHPEEVYRPAVHAAAQRAAFGGADVGYAAFFYPPTYLLICLPLALLPYLGSLAAWLVATGYAYWRTVRAALGSGAGWAAPALAFPAVLINVGHGQNAFLTTALFGGGALMLRTRPILAGLCFGALAFKPHLGVLIPIALVATGRWRTFAAAAATVCATALAALAVFGSETWRGFFAVSALARATLEQNLVGDEKMQSAFAALRLWHAPTAIAYAVQAAVAASAAAILVRLARRGDPEALGPGLIAASLLASPFLLDYDLLLMAVPMAWVLARGRAAGFLPWEKTVLAAAFVLPLVSRLVAGRLGLPLAPPIVLALLMIVVRRGLQPKPSEAPEVAGLAVAA